MLKYTTYTRSQLAPRPRAPRRREKLTEKLGMVISSVSCPDSREIKAGDTFECTAKDTAGNQAVVTVTMTDDKGNVNWKLGEVRKQ